MADVHATNSIVVRSTERPRAWVVPGAVGAAMALATLGVASADPTDSGPVICLSRSLFDLDCPLCGGLRCVDALARGDLLAAADHNVVLAVVLPLLVGAWVWWLIAALRRRALHLPRVPHAVWIACCVALVAFTVVRNLGDVGWIGWLAASSS